ncbi:MAG: 2-amino-4-hydroxy-6-hydroxymethyldihydropteridine diphosphokinase [Bacteroidetes bacterium SW_9_63_38]|nr:MAG: 2-amino-4-hydroxy-6-hydroxymethyldihydropteridine diphosphokinase [Bacteroidetes bacterium SW_9_63_38]
MQTGYLGLGSNQGDRQAHLQAAVDGLASISALRATTVSPVYQTEAHTLEPEETQPAFLNAVVEVEVDCSPERLLDAAQALEDQAGRTRSSERWAPRPLDVDLLSVGTVTCHIERLTLPHPRLAERRFVLQPWADIAPEAWIPAPFSASVQALLDGCADAAALERRGPLLAISASD